MFDKAIFIPSALPSERLATSLHLVESKKLTGSSDRAASRALAPTPGVSWRTKVEPPVRKVPRSARLDALPRKVAVFSPSKMVMLVAACQAVLLNRSSPKG